MQGVAPVYRGLDVGTEVRILARWLFVCSQICVLRVFRVMPSATTTLWSYLSRLYPALQLRHAHKKRDLKESKILVTIESHAAEMICTARVMPAKNLRGVVEPVQMVNKKLGPGEEQRRTLQAVAHQVAAVVVDDEFRPCKHQQCTYAQLINENWHCSVAEA